MRAILALTIPPLAALLAAGSPAQAQDSLVACETQREMEQVIQSGGQLMPDGCRNLVVTRVDSEVGELCVLDFQDPDPGIVGRVTEVAVPTEWWVACAELEAQ